MYNLGNRNYKVCLLDTNAISFIIKNSDCLKTVLDRYPFPEYIYAYSPYVLYELAKNEQILERFKDLFCFFPSLLLKNENELLFEEYSCGGKQPNIWVINPSAISGSGSARNKLDIAISIVLTKKCIDEIEQRIKNNYRIMKDWADWGKNYINKQSEEIIKFRIIEAFGINWVGTILKKDISNLKFDQFPSIKVLSYSWFYKFVSDKTRNTNVNDVVDILNCAYICYSDVFICEDNQKDVLEKLKSKKVIKETTIISAKTLK